MQSKFQQIIAYFIGLYTGGEYSVINAFDNQQEIDLNGVIAVKISNYENLHHGNSKDCRITVNISGQFLTNEDVNQSKIITMFSYIESKAVISSIKAGITQCVGVVLQSGNIQSDGEVNLCSYNIDLYFSID